MTIEARLLQCWVGYVLAPIPFGGGRFGAIRTYFIGVVKPQPTNIVSVSLRLTGY